MVEYLKYRAQGWSQADAIAGIEGILRECWPKPTTKFPACADCDATGWRGMTCWSEHRCGRRWCVDRHPSWEHHYVVPCDCPSGDRHRAKAVSSDEAVAAVGRTAKKKSRDFSRVGQL